jgi:PAS domain S-box-containing protein
MVAEQQPATVVRHKAVRERPGLRRFFLACGAAALLTGSLALYLSPPREAILAVALQTTIIPASILVLVALNQRGNGLLLGLTVVLLWAEALLTAALYTIGVSFAIVIPLIGIGIVQPYLRGTATKAVYVGAGVVATISVALFALDFQPNPLSLPGLAVVGFAFLAAFALGLVWRAGDRWIEALDAADREIAARVEAEQDLAATARLLATLVSSSPVATMTVERDMTVSTWNQAAEVLFGMPAAEVLRRPVELGLPASGDGATLFDVIARAMGGEVVVGDRVRTTRRDGSELHVEVHAAIRRDERGEPVGVVAQVIDVTERARLEASLRQAQRMEAVGRLAGVVAHDLNNAMMAVGGYADLITSDSGDPEAVANAQKIISAADRASRMTHQLLVSAGQSRLQPQVVDIVTFVSGLEDELAALVGPQVRLDLRHEIESGFVRVDPDRFGEALRGLALRARDAMPDGGRLTISTRRAGGDGDKDAMIVVAVTDTGAPIEPDVAERLFDPFLTTGIDPRTGLELAMAFGVVRQSDGEIEVHAGAGGGSTIEIRLPEVDTPRDA